MRYPGRHYRRVYGYPLRWAVLAELSWRLEQAGSTGYRWRKHFERKGCLGSERLETE
jgi:hypothetical protein